MKLWPPISPSTGLVMQPDALFAVGERKEKNKDEKEEGLEAGIINR